MELTACALGALTHQAEAEGAARSTWGAIGVEAAAIIRDRRDESLILRPKGGQDPPGTDMALGVRERVA